MSDRLNHPRRRVLDAALVLAVGGSIALFGCANEQEPAHPNVSAAPPEVQAPSASSTPVESTPTSTAAAPKQATPASFGPLKQINAGVLSVGYADVGPADGPPVILLHGWPYDIYSFVDVAPLLAAAGYHVIVPYLRGYGTTRFLSTKTPRNGQQAAVASDIIALMDALKIQKATIAGFDWGARTGDIMAVVWPERVKALVSVSGYLIAPRPTVDPLPPKAAFAFWYEFYFSTDIGRRGYEKYLHDFNKLIWQTASPKWNFDDATFERSAASFDNPDYVAIAVHNYRWRIGLAEGEHQFDALEKRLNTGPVITVPTITMEGDTNGAVHADSAAYRSKFTGKYEYRLIGGGVGHNIPQEAPQAFAKAVIDADHL